jgi:hypothetical protein
MKTFSYSPEFKAIHRDVNLHENKPFQQHEACQSALSGTTRGNFDRATQSENPGNLRQLNLGDGEV